MPCDEHTREALAELMHELWAGWTQHLLVGTAEDRARWKAQATVPYDKLSDTDKEKDRREADKVIAVLDRAAVLKPCPEEREKRDTKWDGVL
jgi:hypothetical protein